MKKENGRYIVSPLSELFFQIKADGKSGKIDMHYGPSEDKMAVLFTHVEDTSEGSCKFVCTCHQDPSVSNEEFDGQFESLKRELENIKKEFS